MKSISHLLNNSLQAKAAELIKLNHIITSALPTGCHEHVNVAGIRDNQLILITDSPVWASKLRLYRQNLIQMIEEHGGIKISNILIRQSQIETIKTKTPVVKLRHLNRKSARLISQTADTISDPALKQALLHLAQNTKKSD